MAKKKGRIKKPLSTSTQHIKVDNLGDSNKETALFCFQRVQRGSYCFSVLNQENKARVSEAIFRRKDRTWNDLIQADRHGLGTEKIPKENISAAIPSFITDDINHFTVLRYNGLAPMVGYRVGRIFYILWFDPNFSLYDHG